MLTNPYESPTTEFDTRDSEKRDTAGAAATKTRWSILGLMCAAASVAYIQRNVIGVPSKMIQVDLGLSTADVGTVLAAFYWGYATLQVPAGWLADRWGNRGALTFFAVAWSLATASVALTQSMAGLAMVLFLAGAAQAGVFPCATSALAYWMPATTRAFSSGALAAFMNLGAAVAAALAGWLLLELSWRQLFVVAALPGLLWAMIYMWWFRNSPQEHSRVNAAELNLIRAGQSESSRGARDTRPPVPWGRLLSRPTLWAICGQQFFRAAGYIFLATWFPRYLQDARGISIASSGWLSSLPLLSIVAGSLLGGVLADRLLVATGSKRWSRQGVAIAGMLASAVLVGCSSAINDPTAAVAAIAASSFCAFFGGVSSYAITMDMGGRHVATVFSLMNMSGNVGAAIMPMVIGYVLDATGNWNYMLWMVVACYIAATVCWLLINPQGTLVDPAGEERAS